MFRSGLESFIACVSFNDIFACVDVHTDNSGNATDFGSTLPVLRTMTVTDVVTNSLVVPFVAKISSNM